VTRTHGSVRGMMLGSLPNITLLDSDRIRRNVHSQSPVETTFQMETGFLCDKLICG
jgi:hypothetical protein